VLDRFKGGKQMLHGIDVAEYQSSSYSTEGLAFVMVKATEGVTYINPKMAAQAKQARDAGCVVGFYHFLWPGNLAAQAAYFVEKCVSHEEDLLVVDWEWTDHHTRASNAEKDRFLREIKRLRPKHRVLLYCNRDFWLHHDSTSYAGDGLWIAHHTTMGKPDIKADWIIHQYSDSNGKLDKNVAAFKSTADMHTWATALR
jgi:GH25 family lysozyme M1 (1,4-beta-N-acetylmuramidase)